MSTILKLMYIHGLSDGGNRSAPFLFSHFINYQHFPSLFQISHTSSRFLQNTWIQQQAGLEESTKGRVIWDGINTFKLKYVVSLDFHEGKLVVVGSKCRVG